MRAPTDPITRATFLRYAAGFVAVTAVRYPLVTGPLEHPDPRPGITAERIPRNEDLGTTKPLVLEAYDAARAHAEIFDGLACACGCTGPKAPHRSLLTCYESKQATGCHGCMEEGELVTRLIKEDKTLAEIRQAVDKELGR